MAEDGMLVNFSIGEEVLRSKPVFKGGRWRDRLSAKRSTQRPHTKTAEGKVAENEGLTDGPKTTGDSLRPPVKRQRLDESGANGAITFPPPAPNGTPSQVTSARLRKTRKPGSTPQDPHKEVISSLFSYNPRSPHFQTSEPAPTTEPTPSNAALTDPLSTFTSLGLSTQLSIHLLTKFSLKAPTAIQAIAIKQLLSDDSDAFVQAETGSGKTLGYLLPIVQRVMLLSPPSPPTQLNPSGALQEEASREAEKIHRTSGLFCVILAPTRELSTQISRVLSLLLQNTPWIVSGSVIGGEKKKSEKARLRKGLNILVATPGRLADHLSNTEALDVSQVRWLVLDEGDRLMELGFEEEIKGIVEKLERRSGTWMNQPQDDLEASGLRKTRVTMAKAEGEWGTTQRIVKEREGLPRRRVTVLCSATMKMTVQKLGEISLKDAVHIKAESQPLSNGEADSNITAQTNGEEAAFQAPAQLKQSYIVVPPKQRLVTLTALLKQSFARRGTVMKAIVFLSCADSVDFHFSVFAHPTSMTSETPVSNPKSLNSDSITATIAPSPLFSPTLLIHRLHGSLPQSLRTSTLASFTRTTSPSLLLCTDVASRGLDLPNIDLIVEYDPAFSAADHLHRIGRTARAGKPGRAECLLMPGPEEKYIPILQEGVAGGRVGRREAEEILRKGFALEEAKSKGEGNAERWDKAATNWQLEIERWVIEDKRAGEMARKAFVSHVRAYATHIVGERGVFDVKGLHLGHLAKAFALRERPGEFGRSGSAKGGRKGVRAVHQGDRSSQGRKRRVGVEADGNARGGEGRIGKADEDAGVGDGRDAARRMRVKMKEHMASASEFNIG